MTVVYDTKEGCHLMVLQVIFMTHQLPEFLWDSKAMKNVSSTFQLSCV